jgi:hypothetical protein
MRWGLLLGSASSRQGMHAMRDAALGACVQSGASSSTVLGPSRF